MIFLGANASGKGTVVSELQNSIEGAEKLSTSAVLADYAAHLAALQPEVSRYIREAMHKGVLVEEPHFSDALVWGMNHSQRGEKQAPRVVMADGLVRCLEQVGLLARMGIGPSAVLHINVSDDEVLRRTEHRRRNAKLKGEEPRPDDEPHIAKARLEAYRVSESLLIKELKLACGEFHSIDGDRPLDAVVASAKRWAKGFMCRCITK